VGTGHGAEIIAVRSGGAQRVGIATESVEHEPSRRRGALGRVRVVAEAAQDAADYGWVVDQRDHAATAMIAGIAFVLRIMVVHSIRGRPVYPPHGSDPAHRRARIISTSHRSRRRPGPGRRRSSRRAKPPAGNRRR